jgi:hypothetical protein
MSRVPQDRQYFDPSCLRNRRLTFELAIDFLDQEDYDVIVGQRGGRGAFEALRYEPLHSWVNR